MADHSPGGEPPSDTPTSGAATASGPGPGQDGPGPGRPASRSWLQTELAGRIRALPASAPATGLVPSADERKRAVHQAFLSADPQWRQVVNQLEGRPADADALPGPAAGGALDQLISEIIAAYDQGQPPGNGREQVAFRALASTAPQPDDAAIRWDDPLPAPGMPAATPGPQVPDGAAPPGDPGADVPGPDTAASTASPGSGAAAEPGAGEGPAGGQPSPAAGADPIAEVLNRYGHGDPPADEWQEGVFELLDSLAAGEAPTRETDGVARLLGLPERKSTRWELWYADQDSTGAPVTAFTQDAAMRTGMRMSSGGRQVYVMEIPAGQYPRPFATFQDGQLVQPPSFGQPAPGPEAAAATPPRPPVPTVAAAAGDPVHLPLLHPDANRFPDGIWPLPVPAAAGTGLRPSRLLHPDGTALDCRISAGGQLWTGVSAGVIPTRTGEWLQVVRHDDGSLRALHPALVSPHRIDPYALGSFRQRMRYEHFDAAEAADRTTAMLPAQLLEPGDVICPRGEDGQPRTVAASPGPASENDVQITSQDQAGELTARICPARELIEVAIPRSPHPAELGRDAACLFAEPRPVTAAAAAAGAGQDPGARPAADRRGPPPGGAGRTPAGGRAADGDQRVRHRPATPGRDARHTAGPGALAGLGSPSPRRCSRPATGCSPRCPPCSAPSRSAGSAT